MEIAFLSVKSTVEHLARQQLQAIGDLWVGCETDSPEEHEDKLARLAEIENQLSGLVDYMKAAHKAECVMREVREQLRSNQ